MPVLPVPAQADGRRAQQRRAQRERRQPNDAERNRSPPGQGDRPDREPKRQPHNDATGEHRDRPAPRLESAQNELAGGNGAHRRWYRAASNALEHQRAVGTTEAEVVLHGEIDLHDARSVGAVVQVAGGILVEDVDGRGRDLVVHRQRGEH